MCKYASREQGDNVTVLSRLELHSSLVSMNGPAGAPIHQRQCHSGSPQSSPWRHKNTMVASAIRRSNRERKKTVTYYDDFVAAEG